MNDQREEDMFKPWLWRPTSQAVALRNARHASAVLAQRRLEREEIDAYFATLTAMRKSAIGA